MLNSAGVARKQLQRQHVDECESVPITLYLQKQAAGKHWPVDCSLQICGLETGV